MKIILLPAIVISVLMHAIAQKMYLVSSGYSGFVRTVGSCCEGAGLLDYESTMQGAQCTSETLV